MLLSICIPTYNRIDSLNDCLNSIFIADKNQNNLEYEVCISDNGSEEDTDKIIEMYKSKLKIKYNKNEKNLGFALNAIKTVSMSQGDYIWMIGNDDLLMPDALNKLQKIFKENNDVEYFFINSFHLSLEFIKKHKRPFDTANLPISKMKTISEIKQNKKVKFWDVIDPQVSWDFLIGIFLSIFKREKWERHKSILNPDELKDNRYWSNTDNTLIHAKIMCSAFKDSNAFICAEPLSVNLHGEREWGDLYEFIEAVRLPELLDYYRSEGMSLKKYLLYKNFVLRNFSNFLIKIIIGGKKKGLHYINFKKHILSNLFFPNVYISLIRSIVRKVIKNATR